MITLSTLRWSIPSSTILKKERAAGIDHLTAEHLWFSHPAITTVITKSFNIMLVNGIVSDSFSTSYTIPIPKCDALGKALSVNVFRGIPICPVISKIFEHCILDCFSTFLASSDHQFGFKKGSSCSHTIHTIKTVVDYYNKGGSMLNLCALDLSKAFDKVNHNALFFKLMERKLPVELLCIIENWFRSSITCDRWGSITTPFFKLSAGVRQGGALSFCLFAIFIDSIINKIICCGKGCHLASWCVSIILYADDILLLSPSITSLQSMFNMCDKELQSLNMYINPSKSACMRIGPHCKQACLCITTNKGMPIPWCEPADT